MEHINGFKAAVAAVLGGLTALWGWFGWLVLAWLLCMALDYGTGTAAALRAGEWSSKVARDGLWHKLGAVVAVLVAAILDGVIGLILANIPALELPFQYEVFVSVLVLVWYIMTELGALWRTSVPSVRLYPHGSARPSPPWSPLWTARGTSWAATRMKKSK